MKKILFAGCTLALVALPALADGFYVAADVGRDRWSADTLDKSMTANVFTVAGGYTFNLPFKDTLAIELGFRDLGGIYETDTNKTNSLKTDLSAMQFSVIASHFLNDSLSLYGRLGYAEVTVDSKYRGAYGDDSNSNTQDKGFAGIGGRYAINQNVGVHLEYDRYQKLGEVSVSTLLIGADYQF
jgi:opacity protein-like surface antigen